MGIGIVNVDYYELDRQIDVRIDQALNFGDVYGGDLFDDEGKVRTREHIKIGFQAGHVIDILQHQQEQIAELQDKVQNLREVFVTEINSLITGKEDRRE